jgi:hypothetical protein
MDKQSLDKHTCLLFNLYIMSMLGFYSTGPKCDKNSGHLSYLICITAKITVSYWVLKNRKKLFDFLKPAIITSFSRQNNLTAFDSNFNFILINLVEWQLSKV